MRSKQPIFNSPDARRAIREASAADKTDSSQTANPAEKRNTLHTPLGGCEVKCFFLRLQGTEEKEDRVAAVLAVADKLSAAERKELLARLSLATQAPTAQSRDLDMWAEGVYRALDATIGGGEGVGVGPLVLKRLLGAEKNWAPIVSFMQRATLDKLSVAERQSVYYMLATLLVDHAHGVARFAGVPLSSRFVANCSGSIAAIFDAAFPGYLSAGLARMVATQLTHAR